ncbi:MAG: DUF2157 domain-containing protein, partial [Pseudomonadota bacterium]
MRRTSYLRQLNRDLDRWIASGLIDPSQRAGLLAEAGPPALDVPLRDIFIGLGALLVALGALAFVAANWPHLPASPKLALLAAALWGGLAFAYGAGQRDRPAAADAALTAVSLFFGAAIMLVGQMFQMPADRSGLLLVWSLGALLVAVVGPSRGAMAVGFVMAALWSGEAMVSDQDPHLAYLPVWAALAVCAVFLHSRIGLHLAALSLVGWSGLYLVALGTSYGLAPAPLLTLFGLVWFGLALLGRSLAAHL